MIPTRLAEIVAECLHCAQKYDNEDYYAHLKAVVLNLIKFGYDYDENMICAAWLHDTVEDTQMKLNLIKKFFNDDVAELVKCVTNELGENRRERNEKTYPKIRKNSRAVAIKLADRIANVEQGISKGNTGHTEMYRKEHEAFKYALYTPGQHEEMWNHLHELLK